jgi:hypothetical protein
MLSVPLKYMVSGKTKQGKVRLLWNDAGRQQHVRTEKKSNVSYWALSLCDCLSVFSGPFS